MVAQVNITCETDADFYQLFTYTLSDGVTPVNLSGATFNFGVRRSAGDANALFYVTSTLSATGQVIPVTPISGQFALWIKGAQLKASPLGVWAHALVVTLPSAVPISPAQNLNQLIWTGTITINPGPAR